MFAFSKDTMFPGDVMRFLREKQPCSWPDNLPSPGQFANWLEELVHLRELREYSTAPSPVARTVYETAQKASGLKPGDRVRVERPAATNEAGWCNRWSEPMTAMVGSVGEVASIDGCGVEVAFGGSDWNFFFPFFVLTRVEYTPPQTIRPFDRVLARNDGGEWVPTLYRRYDSDSKLHITLDGCSWTTCIPYEGNEDLLGAGKALEEK